VSKFSLSINLNQKQKVETYAHELVHVRQIQTAVEAAVKDLDAPYVPDPGVPRASLKPAQKNECEANMWKLLQPAVIAALLKHDRDLKAMEEKKGYKDSDHEVDARERWPDFMPGKPGFIPPGTQGKPKKQ